MTAPAHGDPPGRASHHRPDIQGLRGVAVLLVVAFHADLPLTGGFVGVDVFFVISGFVITGLLLREWRATGAVDLAGFYVRRMRRLLPALALVVAVTSLLAILLLSPNGRQQDTARTALGAMLFAANLVLPRLSVDYFADAAADNPLVHAWSLSAEEQFYFVFPVIVLLTLRLTGRRAALFPVVAGASGASLAFALVCRYWPAAAAPLGVLADPFYSAPARAWEFGAGAMAALAAPRVLRVGASSMAAASMGIAMIAAAAALFGEATDFPGVAALLPVLGAALVLLSCGDRRSSIGRILGSRPLVALGDVSYSWYLWHWPVLVFWRLLAPDSSLSLALVAIPLSLGLAFLSTRCIEDPIRFALRFRVSDGARLVGAPVAAASILAAALGYGAQQGWGQEWTLGSHAAMQRNCDGGFDPVRCRWAAPGSTGTVLLVGDSQAWALADGLIPAAAALKHDTVVIANNACPFALPQDVAASPVSADCLRHNEDLMKAVQALRPSVVVIANQSAAYAARFGDAWRSALSSAVRSLRASGSGVVIVTVAPLGDVKVTRTSLLLRDTADRSTSLTEQERHRGAAARIDRLVAAEHPGAVVFDPAAVLCDAVGCAVVRSGSILYSDQNHLSRAGALALTSGLQAALARSLEDRPAP